MQISPHDILKQYWGYDSFRQGQEEIVNAVAAGKDVLALLPTGGGKSLCFQVPGLMSGGLTLVISPLIALMKDQVEGLKNKGIRAMSIHSGMNGAEVKRAFQTAAFGAYQFLYLSPERLESALFLEYLPALKPALIAVDEAHCISQWGYDFRPSYLRIEGLRKELPDVNLIALSASATPEIQRDIREKLLFANDAQTFLQSFSRPALSYSAFHPSAKENKLLDVLKQVQGTAIVYCRSRKQTMQTAALLNMHGISADFYHAGLTNDQRDEKQSKWIRNQIRVIVCTNAFGMGIDKPDVRVVLHYELPDCLENYYQEAGRAGRDTKRAYAVLMHYEKEKASLFETIETRFPAPEKLVKVYTALMNHFQVAAGTGEGMSFPVDLAKFSQAFDLNILEATYGIQALAAEGILTFHESLFRHSTVTFALNRNDLEHFNETNPALAETALALLRSYEGIFDYPVTVYESLLAKFMKRPVTNIRQDLFALKAAGVIDYKPASAEPEIRLLLNRMYRDDLKLDHQKISKQKAKALTRAQAMIDFADEKIICRSRLLADYFGADAGADCGICDNCLNRAGGRISAAKFNELADEIFERLRQAPLTEKELLASEPDESARNKKSVIRFLLSEERIRIDDGNRLSVN